MNVYVTYSNSRHPSAPGVYTNMDLATKEREERHDLDCIDILELKGNYNRNLLDVNIDCTYFTNRLITIAKLIECLYELEGCICGGLAHVVLDDDNFDDNSINFVLELCNQEENKDEEEAGLAKLICEELKKLSIQQRALLFSSYYSYKCDGNCKDCPIARGEKAN